MIGASGDTPCKSNNTLRQEQSLSTNSNYVSGFTTKSWEELLLSRVPWSGKSLKRLKSFELKKTEDDDRKHVTALKENESFRFSITLTVPHTKYLLDPRLDSVRSLEIIFSYLCI